MTSTEADEDALFAEFLGEIKSVDVENPSSNADKNERISNHVLKRSAGVAFGVGTEKKELKRPQQTVVSVPAKPIVVSAEPVLVAPLVPTPDSQKSNNLDASNGIEHIPDICEITGPIITHVPGYLPQPHSHPPPQPLTPFQQQQSAYQYIPPKPGDPTGQERLLRKPKKFIRVGGGQVWKDDTLNDWPDNDFRLFVGDLGNEVTDEALTACFNVYSSFQKAKVIRDKFSGKSRGYGFVSFKDGFDMMHAMREKNGKYLGNRPMKIKKSTWQDRNIKEVRKKDRQTKKEKKALGLLISASGSFLSYDEVRHIVGSSFSNHIIEWTVINALPKKNNRLYKRIPRPTKRLYISRSRKSSAMATDSRISHVERYSTPPLTPAVSPKNINANSRPIFDIDCAERLYKEHTVLTSDTLQGICLRYRTTPTELRKLNNFSADQFKVLRVLIVPAGSVASPTLCQDAVSSEAQIVPVGVSFEMDELGSSKPSISQLLLARALTRAAGIAESRARDCLSAHKWNFDDALLSCRVLVNATKPVEQVQRVTQSSSKKLSNLLWNRFRGFAGRSNHMSDIEIELQDIGAKSTVC